MNDALNNFLLSAKASGKNPIEYAQTETRSEKMKDDIKHALWTMHGNTPESYDPNAFDKTSDGTIYIKPGYENKTKSNEGKTNIPTHINLP